jgi:hypothetical protein
MAAPIAPQTFDGFPAEAFAWFEGLEADNSRAWFTAHRDVYESDVRGELEAMLEELADQLGGRVRMFRQHRDVRFSADKSPYKTTTYGVIADRPDSLAALYAQLSATGLFAGTGYYARRRPARALPRRRWPTMTRTGARGPSRRARAGLEVYGEACAPRPAASRATTRGVAPACATLAHRRQAPGARPGRREITRDAALGPRPPPPGRPVRR